MNDDLIHLQVKRPALAAICRRYAVARLSFFGSVLRDDFREFSDVDVLVEFQPDRRIGLLELVRLQMDLEAQLGRSVHICTPGSLSRYFRDEVLTTAVPIYVAA